MTNFRDIFDHVQIPIGLIDPNGMLLEANPALLKHIGKNTSDSLGQPVWTYPYWLDAPGSARKFEKAFQKSLLGHVSQLDTEHTGLNDAVTHLDITLTPVYSDKQVVTSLVIEARDITAIKISQRALIDSEKRLRIMQKFSSDTYWEQDENYRFIDTALPNNGTVCPPMTFEPGKCRWEYPAPEKSNMDWSDHQLMLSQHEPFRCFEYPCIDSSGNAIWITTSGDPIFDSDNVFRGYQGTSRNITMQKASAATFDENETRLRLAVDIASIGIWEWDMITDQVLWDDKQFELFGVPKVNSLIPLSTSIDAIHPDDRERLSKKAAEVLGGGVAAKEEFRVVHPDGTIRWLLGCSGIVHTNNAATSARLIGVNMDITPSKNIEAALRKSEVKLKRANELLEHQVAERTAQYEAESQQHKITQSELAVTRRLEAIGQLAGGVAHDFNNLLAVIGGNLELAAHYSKQKNTSTMIADARLAVESGSTLTNRLLTFARKQVLSPIRFSANQRVLETARLLERILGENIPITLKIDTELWDTFADPYEIDSALINLAVNARDAMPDGGDLLIEALNVVLGDDDIEFSQHAVPGDYVGLFVTDTGIGMLPDVLHKALDPFFTTKEQGKGTGLGLSSVYGFAKQSDGFLTLDSQPGQGTIVRLYLPRATGQPFPEVDAAVTTQPSNSDTRELILVVEDDPMVRKVTTARLKHLGYRVIEASTAGDAMELLNNGAPVALVFSDIVMPGDMTGYDLAKWVKDNHKQIQVLLTSGYIDPDKPFENKAMVSNIKVLRKPHPLELLAKSVREALESDVEKVI